MEDVTVEEAMLRLPEKTAQAIAVLEVGGGKYSKLVIQAVFLQNLSSV